MFLSRTLSSVPDGQWYLHSPRLPRVTVVGDEFRRLGVRFKSWGMQPQHIDFEQRFFSGSDNGKEDMVTFIAGIAAMGVNTVRFHTNLWDFIEGPDKDTLTMKSLSLEYLVFTVEAARQHGLYVILQGSNTWQQELTDPWYDDLGYADRWDVQEFFWSEIAAAIFASGNSSTMLGYDLINEPYISTDPDADWYGSGFGGYYFTHLIARGPEVDSDTMRDWITQLGDAIRVEDPEALITLGALPFYAAYEPVNDLLDFLCPHLYPVISAFGITTAEAMDDLMEWVPATQPLVITETLFYAETVDDEPFLQAMIDNFDGIVTAGCYGYPPEEYTVPPDPPKPPAPANSDPMFYAIFGSSLATFNSYRDEFLGV